jgi:hypothetical protein
MRTTQQMSITLPNELAVAVRAKVASGDYASESESFATVCGSSWPAIARLSAGSGTRSHRHDVVFTPEAEEPLAELYRYVRPAVVPRLHGEVPRQTWLGLPGGPESVPSALEPLTSKVLRTRLP